MEKELIICVVFVLFVMSVICSIIIKRHPETDVSIIILYIYVVFQILYNLRTYVFK